MAEYFPLLFFPEDYFPEGFFAEATGGPTYADGSLTVVGAGSAEFSAKGTARGALVVDGAGSAQIIAPQPDLPLPATPQGGSSGGFGRLWFEARRRRFVDGALTVTGSSSAVMTARGTARGGLQVTGFGNAAFNAEARARAPEHVQQQRLSFDSEMELWLLAA